MLESAQTRRRWCAPLPSSAWTGSPADGVTCPASSLSLDANFSEMLLPDPEIRWLNKHNESPPALCRDPGPLVESGSVRRAKNGHVCPRRLLSATAFLRDVFSVRPLRGAAQRDPGRRRPPPHSSILPTISTTSVDNGRA